MLEQNKRIELIMITDPHAAAIKLPGNTPVEQLYQPQTLRQVFDAYVLSQRFQRRSGETKERQISNASEFVRTYGSVPLTAISANTIRAFAWGEICNPGGTARKNDEEPVTHKATVIREICRFSRDIGAEKNAELARIYEATFSTPRRFSFKANDVHTCQPAARVADRQLKLHMTGGGFSRSEIVKIADAIDDDAGKMRAQEQQPAPEPKPEIERTPKTQRQPEREPISVKLDVDLNDAIDQLRAARYEARLLVKKLEAVQEAARKAGEG